MNVQTIGGHFAAIVENRKNPTPGNYAYESARSCLYSLLRSTKAKRVHIPNYICEAVPSAICDAGATLVRYAIDRQFSIVGELDIHPGDLVLIVDYFGLNEEAVLAQLSRLPQSSVVVDCSQAYFQGPFDCLASIYSPRKFIPVADGGFISSNCMLQVEGADENASIGRFDYLLKRVNAEPELSRDLYLQAEQSLASAGLRSISGFSRKIIETSDQDFIMARRRANFQVLDKLSSINELKFRLGNQVPLCYPLMMENGAEIHEKLKGKRVFTPKYWPNVSPINDFEKALLENTVYLPIDHRYSVEHMELIIDLVATLN